MEFEEELMAINPVVAVHLREARRELIEQREALDRDIAQLDSMLQGYAADASVKPVATIGGSPIVSRGPAPPMKEAIIEHLNSQDRDFTTHEVAVALKEKYGWELSSTRSQIAKMGKSGEVFAVRRGVYRAMTPNVPDSLLAEIESKNASGPDSSGPEVAGSAPASGAGGDVHAPAGHDPDNAASGWNRDRGGDPAIGGNSS